MSATQPGSGSCSGRYSGRIARLARGALVAAGAAGLVACGGGGGGGSTSAPAQITAGNAELITAEVLRSIAIAETLVGDSTVATFGPGEDVVAQGIADASRRSIQRATALDAFDTTPLDCAVTGTARLNGEVADIDTLTAGDVLNATFTNCDDGLGYVINGTLRLVVVTDAVGDVDAGRFGATLDVTFTNLRITADGDTFTGNGTARLDIDTRQSPEEATISGEQLVFTAGSDDFRLTDFAVTLLGNVSGQPGSSSVAAIGTLDSNDIDGRVDFVTGVSFVALDAENPSTGTLDILGAADARIRVTVLDAVNLELAVDTNGDDFTDVTIPTTWSELESLAPGVIGSVLQTYEPPFVRDPS